MAALAPWPAPAAETDAPVPVVLASIKPVHSLVAAVMAGVGKPDLLVEATASPHGYRLKPSQARRLAAADVVIRVGPGLEAFLDKPLRTLAAEATVVTLAESPGLRLWPVRTGGAHEHGEQAHAENAPPADPHLWLDPVNARVLVRAIAAALGRADPGRAERYRANGEAVAARLARLDATIAEDLAPVATRPFVVVHDAFQYFERRYGLAAVGALSLDPDRPPGARRVAELRALMRTTGTRCLFTEPGAATGLARTLSAGSSARVQSLDPLGANLAPGPGLYFRLMENLAAAVQGCLGAQ